VLGGDDGRNFIRIGAAGNTTSVKAIVAAPDHQAPLLKEPGD